MPDPFPPQRDTYPSKDTVFKRLVRFLLDPWNIVLAGVVAVIYCALFYHRLTTGDFWIGYAMWQAGMFSYFWLHELYMWAGGRR